MKAKNTGKMYQKLFVGWCLSSNSSYHPGGRVILVLNPLSFQVDIRWISAQLIHCYVKPSGRDDDFLCTLCVH